MDFIEDHRQNILFLPGIFIKDCILPNDDEMNPNIDYSLMKTENINDIISDDSEDEIFPEPRERRNIDFDDFAGPESDEEYSFNKILKPEKKPGEKYDSIPKFFISPRTWKKSTNLKCWFCQINFTDMPWFIPIDISKILVPENDETEESYISLLTTKINDCGIVNDDNMMFNCQPVKEVKAYKTHGNFCDISCAGTYLDMVTDIRIINKRESGSMLLDVYRIIKDEELYDIPKKELWTSKKQYSGESGYSDEEYDYKNCGKEIRFKKIKN
jgi:hypothetical protein